MALDGFLTQAATYLGAAVISVPLASRLGLGSVLGYLVAGIVVGPSLLGLVSGGSDMMHVAEFGVVMMLFLIGLELKPPHLWQMRAAVFGLGSLQMALTALVLGGAALLLGNPLGPSLAVGLILAMSSTAMVLQALSEKGLLKTHAGQTSLSVLLFQDIAVIPILALMPLLALKASPQAMTEHSVTLFDDLPGWAAAAAVLAAVGLIIAAGRFIMRPLFRMIAKTHMREVFTATALLLVTGTALLMQAVGLSPALGAFLAGVVLADSEFRHEIETDIEPFKGLLLGLFFISVGAGLDLGLIAGQPLLICALVAGIVFVKASVVFAVARFARLKPLDALLTAVALSQIGEFAFVLLSFASQTGIFERAIANLLTVCVALSMLTTPLLLILFERFAMGRPQKEPERPADSIAEQNRVIIAGFGRMGQIAGRLLIGRGIPVTVLEHDAEQLETLRRFGFTLYYGDARRHDLLHAAGAAEASVLVVATDQRETTDEIVAMARRNFPRLRIVARAFDRPHAYDLETLGAHRVIRETFAGGVEMAVETLKELGVPAFEAERTGRTFRRHDLETMTILGEIRRQNDEVIYRRTVRERGVMLGEVLTRDLQTAQESGITGWNTESLREEIRAAANDAAQDAVEER